MTQPSTSLEDQDLLGYRSALLALFPRGSNVRAKKLRPGTIARVNEAFKALQSKHKRRLERLRCTVDRLEYIEHVTQKEEAS